MSDHRGRIDTARAAIDFLASRTDAELDQQVPNCPGWTVYNAVVHVGRIALGWAEGLRATPGDDVQQVRARAGALMASQPSRASLTTLAQWAHDTLDQFDRDPATPAFFFAAADGHGDLGLWARYAASEYGLHRLDGEDALGLPNAMTTAEAVDACDLAVTTVLVALAARSGTQLPSLRCELLDEHGDVGGTTHHGDGRHGAVVARGPATEVLKALWGRPANGVDVSNPRAFDIWTSLPSQNAQWGTWD